MSGSQLTRLSSLLLSGLIAGTFFYGTFCVLPAFYEVSSTVHLTFRTNLMNHNKITVMVLVLLSLLTNIVYCWQTRNIRIVFVLSLIALALTTVSLVITRLGSVPINLQMKTWNSASPPTDWLETLKRWDLYNGIRTATSIGSFICLLSADNLIAKTTLQNNSEQIGEYDSAKAFHH